MIYLSVIIPVYNVEKYISKCIYSLYKQGMSEDDFEIIVVDDESPDQSISIVKEICKVQSNIFVFSQKNKGLGGARNTGINNANGEYLLFLDSDDYLLENTIRDVINIALKNKLDIVEFGCQGILPNSKIIYEVSKSTNGIIYNGITYYNTLKYMNSACNKLYKRNMLIENKIFFLEKIYIEDFEFNTRSFFYAQRVMAIKNIVAHYLQSPNSITRNTSKDKKQKMLTDQISVLRRTIKFRNNNNTHTKSDLNVYFGTRVSFLNISIFYHLLKTKSTYKELVNTKKLLQKELLFDISYPVSVLSKDIFRKFILNKIWLYRLLYPFI